MTILTGITEQPNQQIDLRLEGGGRAKLTLNYRVQQTGWFLDVVWLRTGGDPVSVLGLRVVTSPNLLRQYQNVFPFGLAVVTEGNAEPVTVRAFADQTSRFLLLDADGVGQIEQEVFTGL